MPHRLAQRIVAALGEQGVTRTRRMFGGIALFHNAQVFGIVFEDAVFFRVNEVTRKAYERARMPPLKMPGVQNPSSRYMQVPPAVLENPASLRAWARQAIATSAVDADGAKREAGKRTPSQR
jgi:DNA transformation protein